MNPKTKYIIKISAAKMPGSCWGIYRRIAILEVTADTESVKMISERARGVVRIVHTWEKLHVGHTARCAFQRALTDAKACVERLTQAAAVKADALEEQGLTP